jgi:quercetin dioxygenase-like cupin family protein
MKMVAGGESKILKVGEGVVIPPNVEHEVIPLEPNTKVMDVFYPIREDYL